MHCIGDIWRYVLGLRSLAGAARYEPEHGENQRQCPNFIGWTGPAATSGRGLLPQRSFEANQNANQAKANSVLFAEAFVPIPS